MAEANDLGKIRDILCELVPGSDALDEETLTTIARSEPVSYDAHDTAAALDLSQIVHALQVAVPIVSGMLSIGKILYEAARGGARSYPTADEIADTFLARCSQADLRRLRVPSKSGWI